VGPRAGVGVVAKERILFFCPGRESNHDCPAISLHGLGPLASSDRELTFETMNPFRYFGRLPWMGDGLNLQRTAKDRKKRARTAKL
jgi:hypothetical protein